MRFVLEISLCLALVYVWQQRKKQIQWLKIKAKERWKAHRQKRHLHPKTPDECPLCCGTEAPRPRTPDSAIAYPEHKSKRGRKKALNSEGFACLNPDCVYYGVTDAGRHALVGDGRRGKAGDIQRWRCQGCQHPVSARCATPLFRLKRPAWCVEIALYLLCIGVSRAQIARLLGVDERTVALWLERAGKHGERLHQHSCQNQEPAVVQMDELMARVRSTVKRWWVWFALDPHTKVLLSLHLGSRKTDSAMGFVHALVATFTPGYCPLFLSDGLPAYFYALTAHCGQWVGGKWQVAPRLAYAQMIKILRWRHLIACFPRVLCGSLPSIRGHLRNAGFSGQIQTAYIERLNLTARQHIAALLRRSWSTYRKPARLQAHLELFRGFYHFVRPHQSLAQQRLERTPAMAAGWTDHLWSMSEWITHPVFGS